MKLTIGSFMCAMQNSVINHAVRSNVTISKDEVRSLVLEDSNIQDVEIDIVRPGEKKRIVHVLIRLNRESNWAKIFCIWIFIPAADSRIWDNILLKGNRNGEC